VLIQFDCENKQEWSIKWHWIK